MSRLPSLSSATGVFASMPSPPSAVAPDLGTEMTISQMSRLYTVSLRTLRFYEDRGMIRPRRDGNARFYRPSDRIRLEMILRGKKLGFTLSEIQELIGGKGPTETPDLEEQLQPHQILNQIVHLERQREEIDGAIGRLRATQTRLSGQAA